MHKNCDQSALFKEPRTITCGCYYMEWRFCIHVLIVNNVILAEAETQNKTKNSKSGLSDYEKRKPSMAQKH